MKAIVTVRHARIEDAHIIGEAQRTIAKEPGLFCSQPFELTDQNIERSIAEFLEKKNSVFFVAECEGNIVGHAFLDPLSTQSLQHVAELNIVVHKGWQEKGIGTQLMDKLIEWAKHSSTIEKIELNVRASNTKAISLYKKKGFLEEGRLKKRVKLKDRYLDDIIMALNVKDNQFNERDNIVLRTMKEEDINSLINTFCFPWETIQKTTEKWNGYYAEQRTGIRTVCLVETQNQLVGYGSLVRSSKYSYFKNVNIPEIHDVWISEDRRNQGFGKALIHNLEGIARSEGLTQIGLGVGLYRDYGSAQRLYYRMGYSPDGNGITYKYQPVVPGESYPADDELVLWLKKPL